MTDPAGSDRLECGVPTGEQPARPGSDASPSQRAEPDAREVEP